MLLTWSSIDLCTRIVDLMELEDKFDLKCVQSISSSVQSTPEKNGNSEDANGRMELHHGSMNPGKQKEFLRACFEKDKKHSSQCKNNAKASKKLDFKKNSSCPSDQIDRKLHRKLENPIRVVATSENLLDSGTTTSLICINLACGAELSIDEAFCGRCSCYICHLFDDERDPSLWLACKSDTSSSDSCGSSCHIECALQHEKAGVVDRGQFMQLDGSYCCSSCGKVSGIIGFLKEQLAIAKDVRSIDALCYRVSLCCRLLDGTKKYEKLQSVVKEAKSKLDTEIGPLNSFPAMPARGPVTRLSVYGEVHKLCSLAIEQVDDLLSTTSMENPHREDFLCKFFFEEVTSTSVSIIIISAPDEIKAYKMWYCTGKEDGHKTDPNFVFPSSQRRISVSNLLPCTEYSFRIVSLADDGEVGLSEAKCFTMSKEISKHHRSDEKFQVRELGNSILDASRNTNSNATVSRQLDLNVTSVPDLNEDLIPADDDTTCNESRIWTRGAAADIPAVDSWTELHRKMSATEECDSALINESPCVASRTSASLDENFEYCVKIIRWLECEGHIKHEFRLRLLTWFSVKSTEQERRVVNTFIQTLIDDPSSLAGQLVDAFADVISSAKKRRMDSVAIYENQ